jgi:hypothetical protein
MHILALVLAAATAQPVPAHESVASEAFRRLSDQAGLWNGTRPSGSKPVVVSIRKIAGGSAIVETWYPGTAREALTIYHMDGPVLVADHYCPQGNAPRLILERRSTAGDYFFSFKEGTNLTLPGAYHEHEFRVRPTSLNSYDRTERYVENGMTALPEAGDGEVITFRRAPE